MLGCSGGISLQLIVAGWMMVVMVGIVCDRMRRGWG